MGIPFLAFLLCCAVPSSAARVTRGEAPAFAPAESLAETASLGCCCRDLGTLDDVHAREAMCEAQKTSARIAFPGATGHLQGGTACCVQSETCSGASGADWRPNQFCEEILPAKEVNRVLHCCCQDVTSMPDPEDREAVCEARISSARVMVPTATGRLQGGRACCVQREEKCVTEEARVDQWCFQSLESVVKSLMWDDEEKAAQSAAKVAAQTAVTAAAQSAADVAAQTAVKATSAQSSSPSSSSSSSGSTSGSSPSSVESELNMDGIEFPPDDLSLAKVGGKTVDFTSIRSSSADASADSVSSGSADDSESSSGSIASAARSLRRQRDRLRSGIEKKIKGEQWAKTTEEWDSSRGKPAVSIFDRKFAGGIFGTRKAVWQMLTGVSPYMTTPPEALHVEEMGEAQKQLYEQIRFRHKAVWARQLESYRPLKTASTIAAVATLGVTELVKKYAYELGDPEHWWFIMQGKHEDHARPEDPTYYFVAQFGTGNVGVNVGNQSASAQTVTATLAMSFTAALVMGQYSARGVRELHPWIHFPVAMYGSQPKERNWGAKNGWEKVTRDAGYTLRELEEMVKTSPSSTEWNDGKYHLLKNNCQHFAREMYYKIVV